MQTPKSASPPEIARSRLERSLAQIREADELAREAWEKWVGVSKPLSERLNRGASKANRAWSRSKKLDNYCNLYISLRPQVSEAIKGNADVVAAESNFLYLVESFVERDFGAAVGVERQAGLRAVKELMQEMLDATSSLDKIGPLGTFSMLFDDMMSLLTAQALTRQDGLEVLRAKNEICVWAQQMEDTAKAAISRRRELLYRYDAALSQPAALELIQPFSQAADTPKTRILFLGVNPLDSTPLRLDEEVRVIDRALTAAALGNRCQLTQKWAVRVSELQEHLLLAKPNIVHFSGHGSADCTIAFQGEDGATRPVAADRLARLLAQFNEELRCVILNACYTKEHGEAVAEHIDCVVGMSSTVSDAAAIRFAAAFYLAIASGYSVADAFEQAKADIELGEMGEDEIPSLLAKRCDPGRVFLVTERQVVENSGTAEADCGGRAEEPENPMQLKSAFPLDQDVGTETGRRARIAEEYASLFQEERIYFLSLIPEEKLDNAYSAYALQAFGNGEKPLCLVDDSPFSSGKVGCLVTDEAIYYKRLVLPSAMVSFSEIQTVSPSGIGPWKVLCINSSHELEFANSSQACLKLFARMVIDMLA